MYYTKKKKYFFELRVSIQRETPNCPRLEKAFAGTKEGNIFGARKKNCVGGATC